MAYHVLSAAITILEGIMSAISITGSEYSRTDNIKKVVYATITDRAKSRVKLLDY
jgi:hypothetical protein